MSAKFFLQLAQSSEGFWEEVDEFVYENWKYAVIDEGAKEGSPRYNGNRVKHFGGEVEFSVETKMKPKDFAWIARFIGCGTADFNGQVAGGIVRDPSYVKLHKRNQIILKKIHGQAFVAREQNGKKSEDVESHGKM